MFSYVSLEQRVPADHPLRAVRQLTETVLGSPAERGVGCAVCGLRATVDCPGVYSAGAVVAVVFYSVRSERLLVEQT